MSGWLDLQKILDRKEVDPLDIVNEFTKHPPDQQPCPLHRDDYWLKKLCAVADQMVKIAKDRLRIIEEYKASVEDLAKEHSRLARLIIEAADSVHASLAETDISDDRRNYRIGLEERLRKSLSP